MNNNPVEDILNARRRIENEEFRPVIALGTTNQAITLRAAELFFEWKRAWRKQHRILAFLEKESNKITGRPQQ